MVPIKDRYNNKKGDIMSDKMKKNLAKGIPIITLVIFILVMLSGNYLKRPIGKDDDVVGFIEIVIEDVNDENWEVADKNREKLEDAWNKIVKRIQFSSERSEMNELDASLARLKGAIMAKDKGLALAELNVAYEHWKSLGR
ncbi:hypothetical protein N072000002_02510 [Clostridium tetani]|uniref:DUF4363 family protein n=3 Tax=Clostridium tetani TaxID=1513 RepID=A0A4Q0VDR8_CLOTA|nr:DUF4363 family protein [Clostridium tetani]CDI48475.1 hypothetical protein BN906_00440 [Clostridium tetani 12124569]RXI58642.1 DUF4363 family protein [Clostridium tetani]RXI73355.1 DUF4363 family protein [Clostridium tetani]BDR66019.1 hypothetical protein K144312032_02470 [Clostridium tetani]